MVMIRNGARGRGRRARRRISRGAKYYLRQLGPRRGLAALRFFSRRRRGESANDRRSPPVNEALWRAFGASLFRWRVRGKSSGRLFGFLHAFIPSSVRGASRTRSEASARPWRRKWFPA
ncbi:unnamed protein product, partial [Pelagomonas calceolata]